MLVVKFYSTASQSCLVKIHFTFNSLKPLIDLHVEHLCYKKLIETPLKMQLKITKTAAVIELIYSSQWRSCKFTVQVIAVNKLQLQLHLRKGIHLELNTKLNLKGPTTSFLEM